MMFADPQELRAAGIAAAGCGCMGKYVPTYMPEHVVAGMNGGADVGSAALDTATAIMKDDGVSVKKYFEPVLKLAEAAALDIPPPWGEVVALILGALEMAINRVSDNLEISVASIPTHVPAQFAVPAMAWVKKNIPSLMLATAKDFIADRAGSYLPSSLPGDFNAKVSSRLAGILYNKLIELGADPKDAAIVGYRACSGDRSNKKDNRPWDPPAALQYATVLTPSAPGTNYKNRDAMEKIWKDSAKSRGLKELGTKDYKDASKKDPKTAAHDAEVSSDNTMLYVGAAAVIAAILLTRK